MHVIFPADENYNSLNFLDGSWGFLRLRPLFSSKINGSPFYDSNGKKKDAPIFLDKVGCPNTLVGCSSFRVDAPLVPRGCIGQTQSIGAMTP